MHVLAFIDDTYYLLIHSSGSSWWWWWSMVFRARGMSPGGGREGKIMKMDD